MGARNIASVAIALRAAQDSPRAVVASGLGCSYDGGVLELEVYAVGARDRNKILKK
jgi:hypothetical protein